MTDMSVAKAVEDMAQGLAADRNGSQPARFSCPLNAFSENITFRLRQYLVEGDWLHSLAELGVSCILGECRHEHQKHQKHQEGKRSTG